MHVGRSNGEARTPVPKGQSAVTEEDRLNSPHYVPGQLGNGASLFILQAQLIALAYHIAMRRELSHTSQARSHALHKTANSLKDQEGAMR